MQDDDDMDKDIHKTSEFQNERFKSSTSNKQNKPNHQTEIGDRFGYTYVEIKVDDQGEAEFEWEARKDY